MITVHDVTEINLTSIFIYRVYDAYLQIILLIHTIIIAIRLGALLNR